MTTFDSDAATAHLNYLTNGEFTELSDYAYQLICRHTWLAHEFDLLVGMATADVDDIPALTGPTSQYPVINDYAELSVDELQLTDRERGFRAACDQQGHDLEEMTRRADEMAVLLGEALNAIDIDQHPRLRARIVLHIARTQSDISAR